MLIGEKTKVPGAVCPTQGHIAEKYTRVVVVVGGWSKRGSGDLEPGRWQG